MNLERACRVGDEAAIKEWVVYQGYDINEIDQKVGWTPLYRTVIWNHFKATKQLLQLGADPNLKNKLGETPLIKAVESGSGRITKLLLDNRANPNIPNGEGETALHFAVLKQYGKIALLLLRKGSKPNTVNKKHGKTALHYAVELGLTKITEVLIAHEASPLVRDNSGKTALELATSPEIQRILVEPPRPTDSPSTFAGTLATSPQEFKEGEDGEDTEQKAIEAAYQGIPSPMEIKKSPESVVEEYESEFERVVEGAQPNKESIGSSSKRDHSPVLLQWLKSIKLEEIYDTLLAAGYDDIEMMSEQMKSHMPITVETLEGIGVQKPGHRARVLAHLMNETWMIPGKQGATPGIFSCCSVQPSGPALFNHPDIMEWLNSISLKELHPKFFEAGYDDHEQIMFLMNSDYALNDQVLEHQIRVTKPGHRHRILIRLQQDAALMDRAPRISFDAAGKS